MDFYKSSIWIICNSETRYLLLTGQENRGLIVHYLDHHSNNRLKQTGIQITILITGHLIIGVLLTIQMIQVNIWQWCSQKGTGL